MAGRPTRPLRTTSRKPSLAEIPEVLSRAPPPAPPPVAAEPPARTGTELTDEELQQIINAAYN